MPIIQVSDLKTYLMLPSDYVDEDDKLEIIVSAVNLGIDKYIGRTLAATPYIGELYDGPGQEALCVRNFPIISIQNIYIGGIEVPVVPTNMITSAAKQAGGTDYQVGDLLYLVDTADSSGSVIVTAVDPDTGAVLNVTLESAGNQYTLGAKNTTGGSGAGCTITITGIAPVVTTMPYGTLGYYYVQNPDHGIIFHSRCWPSGRAIITINYQAGYETIPADIFMAALEMASTYRNLTQKPGVISESAGSYSVNLAGIPAEGGLIPSIPLRAILDDYRANYYASLVY